jgi:hypothetical protein
LNLSPASITAALVAISLVTAAQAQAASNCLTTEEAGGLVTYALPATIKGLSSQCAKTLPATAAIVQGGPVLAARYQIEADRAWPMARTAFDKMSGSELTKVIGDDGARAMIDGILGTAITQKLKPEDCGTVDRLVNALQPLPARNMADLVIVLMEVGSKNEAKGGPFNLCKPGQN